MATLWYARRNLSISQIAITFSYELDSTEWKKSPATDSEMTQHRITSCPGANNHQTLSKSLEKFV
jgi:hypothetical protein